MHHIICFHDKQNTHNHTILATVINQTAIFWIQYFYIQSLETLTSVLRWTNTIDIKIPKQYFVFFIFYVLSIWSSYAIVQQQWTLDWPMTVLVTMCKLLHFLALQLDKRKLFYEFRKKMTQFFISSFVICQPSCCQHDALILYKKKFTTAATTQIFGLLFKTLISILMLHYLTTYILFIVPRHIFIAAKLRQYNIYHE